MRGSTPAQPLDLEWVFGRYFDSVYRYLYRQVGNREDAEDLTSDVFLKASKGLDGARAEASVAHWLFTVARTVLADHWRHYYRLGATTPLDESNISETPAFPAHERSSETNDRLVAEVLHLLPTNYRSVLDYRFLRGYTIEETAQELGLSVANVKVIQHRALQKAVQLMGERA